MFTRQEQEKESSCHWRSEWVAKEVGSQQPDHRRCNSAWWASIVMDDKRGKNGMIVDEGPGRVEVRQCQGVPGEDTFGKQCSQHCPQHHIKVWVSEKCSKKYSKKHSKKFYLLKKGLKKVNALF